MGIVRHLKTGPQFAETIRWKSYEDEEEQGIEMFNMFP